MEELIVYEQKAGMKSKRANDRLDLVIIPLSLSLFVQQDRPVRVSFHIKFVVL